MVCAGIVTTGHRNHNYKSDPTAQDPRQGGLQKLWFVGSFCSFGLLDPYITTVQGVT